MNPIQGQWFRDFSDVIHERVSRLKEDDKAGREHLFNLLHVAVLFRRGLEHYILQGEDAKIELERMMDDKPKKGFWGGIV